MKSRFLVILAGLWCFLISAPASATVVTGTITGTLNSVATDITAWRNLRGGSIVTSTFTVDLGQMTADTGCSVSLGYGCFTGGAGIATQSMTLNGVSSGVKTADGVSLELGNGTGAIHDFQQFLFTIHFPNVRGWASTVGSEMIAESIVTNKNDPNTGVLLPFTITANVTAPPAHWAFVFDDTVLDYTFTEATFSVGAPAPAAAVEPLPLAIFGTGLLGFAAARRGMRI